MKTNNDKWIDAAIMFLEYRHLEHDDLVELVNGATGVPKDLLRAELDWYRNECPLGISNALQAYLDGGVEGFK